MRSKKGGQSLVELILALGVLVVVIVGLLRTTSLSLRNINFSVSQNEASLYASEVIEELKILKSKGEDDFFSNYLFLCQSQNGTRGSLTRTVECVLPEGDDRLEVTTTVNWEDPRGAHEVKQKTFLTKYSNE